MKSKMNPSDYHVFKGGRDFVVARDVAEAVRVLDLYGCIDDTDEVFMIADKEQFTIATVEDDDGEPTEHTQLTCRQWVDLRLPTHGEAFWLCREE